jgi:hypothetical protein
MRTHPLGVICVDKTHGETFRIATEFSLVTHADPRCVVACCISTGLIRGILRGELQSEKDIDAIIEIALEWVTSWQKRGRRFEDDPLTGTDDEWVDASVKKEEDEASTDNPNQTDAQATKFEPPLDRTEFFKYTKAKHFFELELDDSMKMGYVYKSLGAAILALRRAMHESSLSLHAATSSLNKREEEKGTFSRSIFENLITTIVMEGGDADTNACIAGALLGAWLGYNALPPHWRDGIEHLEWLLEKCGALIATVGIDNDSVNGYRGSEDPDTREDGGRGFLSREALEKREMVFMEMYLGKMAVGKGGGEAESRRRGWKEKLFAK